MQHAEVQKPFFLIPGGSHAGKLQPSERLARCKEQILRRNGGFLRRVSSEQYLGGFMGLGDDQP